MTEDWRSEDDKRLDLQIENAALEQEVALRGGVLGPSGNAPPEIHNQFLRNVIEFEEMDKGPKRPLRSLFPEDYEFPASATLTDEQLDAKVNDIKDILEQFGIFVELRKGVPDRVAYDYIVQKVIPVEEVSDDPSPRLNLIFDGCTGGCDACFQRQWCDVPDELDAWDDTK